MLVELPAPAAPGPVQRYDFQPTNGPVGVPLRVSTRLGALRPRIPVAVEGHAFDAQTLTPLLELCPPVAAAHGAKVGEQGAGLWKRPQDLLDLRPEMNLGQFPVLLSPVSDEPLVPVDVLGAEQGHVGLGAAQVPAEFVERPALFKSGVAAARPVAGVGERTTQCVR